MNIIVLKPSVSGNNSRFFQECKRMLWCIWWEFKGIMPMVLWNNVTGGAVNRIIISETLAYMIRHKGMVPQSGWWRILPCKAKRQYLLTLQVSRYCLVALQNSIHLGNLCLLSQRVLRTASPVKLIHYALLSPLPDSSVLVWEPSEMIYHFLW